VPVGELGAHELKSEGRVPEIRTKRGRVPRGFTTDRGWGRTDAEWNHGWARMGTDEKLETPNTNKGNHHGDLRQIAERGTRNKMNSESRVPEIREIEVRTPTIRSRAMK